MLPKTFPSWPNLTTPEASFAFQPWDWDASEERIALLRNTPKPKRREMMKSPDMQWNVYSCALAENWFAPVGGENKVHALLGMVLDYDVVLDPTFIEAACSQREKLKGILPSFICTTLSGRVHAVWLFEAPLLVAGNVFADHVLQRVGELVDAQGFLPGLDRNSFKSTMRWTNGGYWLELPGVQPISTHVLSGVAMRVSSSLLVKHNEIPFDAASRALLAKFPRFKEFNGGILRLGATGPRFWVDGSDNPKAAMCVADGFYCFTGEKPIVPYEDLLSKTVVAEMRLANLGNAADGFWYDSRSYFERTASGLSALDRNDVLLRLSARGLSRARGKDELMSQAEQALNFIQVERRVDGAAPLLFRDEGVVLYNHKTILNTMRDNLMRPCPDIADATPEKFPWLWSFLNVFFAHPENLPLDHFLSWWRHFYSGALNRRATNGQAIFICGPRECGKNFVSELLLPMAMGSNAPNPYRFLMGDTDFSDDILESAVLAINDEDAPPEHKRTIFEQKVKSMVANNEHAYHPKFMKKVRIPWEGRLIVTLNDGPKDVAMLPMLSRNTGDKMSFFLARCNEHKFYDKATNRERAAGEMPFFLRWLVDVYVPPAGVVCGGRMGVRSYHDRYLIDVNRHEQPSYNFLELVSSWIRPVSWNKGVDQWCGTPTDLLRDMSGDETLEHLIRDWKPSLVSKALADLSRAQVPGIHLDKNSRGRCYVLSKVAILAETTGSAIPPAGQQMVIPA